MYPYLFDWVVNGYHFRPPTFGVFLALSFSTGYFLSLYYAHKKEEDPSHIENLFLVVVGGSVLGSRLFHVLFEEPSYYFAHPWKIFAIWEGGYTLYGAILMGILGMYLYTKKKNLSFLQFVDIVSVGTAFGIGIGRLGCFLAGCCWGKATDVPWAVTYTHPDAFNSVRGIPVHPTQLYEAFGLFLLYAFLHWRLFHRKYRGQVFFEAMSVYAVIRFIIEIYRGDEYRGFVFNGALSYSQFVSLVILPFTLIAMYAYSRQAKR